MESKGWSPLIEIIGTLFCRSSTRDTVVFNEFAKFPLFALSSNCFT